MKIKNQEAFKTAQRVAAHAANGGSQTAWATAMKHLAAAYGYARIEWYEKHSYVL